MQLQRLAGNASVGARIDGMYYKEIPAAFEDACRIYERAYNDGGLWSFLDTYSNAWSNLQTELHESSLALSWSIIERDLLKQLTRLINQTPAGNVMKLNNQGVTVNMTSGEENSLRNRLSQGESPMAGKMISILTAHQIHLHADLGQVKTARNNHQHSGASVDPERCRDALRICAEACKREYSIEINCRLHANAHLGITC